MKVETGGHTQARYSGAVEGADGDRSVAELQIRGLAMGVHAASQQLALGFAPGRCY
jgi:hypothetical protein